MIGKSAMNSRIALRKSVTRTFAIPHAKRMRSVIRDVVNGWPKVGDSCVSQSWNLVRLVMNSRIVFLEFVMTLIPERVIAIRSLNF